MFNHDPIVLLFLPKLKLEFIMKEGERNFQTRRCIDLDAKFHIPFLNSIHSLIKKK